MSGVKISNIVKRSISLSPVVNQWAEEMAVERGFGTNFSAFVADLVRRSKEREAAASSASPAALAEAIVSEAVSAATGAAPPVASVKDKSKSKAARRSKARRAQSSSDS